MAGALVVATHERADALGVPPDRRVYPRGWCYARDPVLVAEHPDLRALAGDGGRERGGAAHRAGVGVDDVALPRPLLLLRELAALRVRRARHRQPTIRAASRSPAACRITAARRAGTSPTRSRRWSSGCAPSPSATGLVSGVGMHMTKHVFGVYSTDARARSRRPTPASAGRGRRGGPAAVVAEHDGDATVARLLGRARPRRRARVGAARLRPARRRQRTYAHGCADADAVRAAPKRNVELGRHAAVDARRDRRDRRRPDAAQARREPSRRSGEPAAIAQTGAMRIRRLRPVDAVIDRDANRSLGCAGTITVTPVTLGVTRSAGSHAGPISQSGGTT